MKQSNIIKIYLTIVILLVLISCKIDFEDGDIKFEKDEFKYERTIEITDESDYKVFLADVDFGEVKLEDGNLFDLKVKIFEEVENDVSISLQNGELIGTSSSGKEFAIGDISGTIPSEVSLDLDSGSGDISIKGFNNNYIIIDTGAGNVILSACKCKKEIDIDTGAGNISLENINAFVINLDTGAGNISLKEVSADEIDSNSGVGNISAFNAKARTVDFDTGIGNISTVECDFENDDFSTGIGKIRNSGEKSFN